MHQKLAHDKYHASERRYPNRFPYQATPARHCAGVADEMLGAFAIALTGHRSLGHAPRLLEFEVDRTILGRFPEPSIERRPYHMDIIRRLHLHQPFSGSAPHVSASRMGSCCAGTVFCR